MALFNLLGKLGLDATGFNAGLKKAESGADKLAHKLKHELRSEFAKLFAVEKIYQAVEALKQFAEQTEQLSDKLGVSITKAEQLLAVAAKFGIPVDKLGSAIDRLGESRRKALEEGDPKALAAFAHFGIDLNATNKKGITDEMVAEQLGKAMKGRTMNPDDRAAFADIVGIRGKGLMAAFTHLGDTTLKPASEENVETVVSFLHGLTEFSTQLKAFGIDFLGPLIRKGQQSENDNRPVEQRIAERFAKFGFNPMMGFTAIAMEAIKSAQQSSAEIKSEMDNLKGTEGASSDAGDQLYYQKMKENKLRAAKMDAFSGIPGSGYANQGGFFFGADAALRSVPQQQLEVQRSMDERLANIERVVTYDDGGY
jgi:hypothetical protein